MLEIYYCPECETVLDARGECVICGYRRPSVIRPENPPRLATQGCHPWGRPQAARARELLAGLVQGFSLDAGRPVPLGATSETWELVRRHAWRLQARGLEEQAAWRLGEALVSDPHHREHCEVCNHGS